MIPLQDKFAIDIFLKKHNNKSTYFRVNTCVCHSLKTGQTTPTSMVDKHHCNLDKQSKFVTPAKKQQTRPRNQTDQTTIYNNEKLLFNS